MSNSARRVFVAANSFAAQADTFGVRFFVAELSQFEYSKFVKMNSMNSPNTDAEIWDDDPFADDARPSFQQFHAPQKSISETQETQNIEDAEDLANELLPPEKQQFVIRDASDASWVVRKIVEARARQTRIKDWAALELKSAQREEKFFLERFGSELEAWTAENNGGKKTLRLPDGTLGFRSKRAIIQIKDEDRVLDWCRDNLPEAVKTVESVLKTPLNEHLKETGELPPGCDLDAGGDEFYVR